jgi:hypothetical protein
MKERGHVHQLTDQTFTPEVQRAFPAAIKERRTLATKPPKQAMAWIGVRPLRPMWDKTTLGELIS